MKTLAPDNAMLVLALKSISDCVCISDIDDNIIFVNESFTKTYGYTTEELLGKPVSMVRSENNCPVKISVILPETLKGGWRGELVNLRKDGTEFTVNIATSVILGDDGLPMAMMGIAKDITATKQMQAKFRSVADLFQRLGTDTAKNIDTIVASACNVIGGAASLYNKLDNSECSLVVWAGHNLPRDMARSDVPKGHICYEATIKGRYGLKSYLGAPVSLRGKAFGALAIVDTMPREFSPEEIDLIGIFARAISLEEERQDANIMLETAIEQSPSGILIADAPDMKIRIANSKAMAILYDNEEQEINSEFHGIRRSWNAFRLDGTQLPVETLPLSRAVIYGEITESEELLIRTNKGCEHVVSVNAAPLKNKEGIITGGVVMFHDITVKKQIEQNLRDSEERLRTLINAMPDIVCFKDGHGRWLEANDVDVKLFELEGVNYIGKKDSELALESGFYRNAFLTCEESDELAWRQKIPTRADEIIPCRDGSSKVFDVIKVPTFDDKGGRQGLIIVGRDVTERQHTETALKEKALELEAFNALMIGRELKMIELKKEINQLLIKSGCQEKYIIHE
ncbi:MAG: PAS domain S-box protein [Bacteroidetes bacterium]|nr:PAS domain S-box protein [Bacteroidota bacterium]